MRSYKRVVWFLVFALLAMVVVPVLVHGSPKRKPGNAPSAQRGTSTRARAHATADEGSPDPTDTVGGRVSLRLFSATHFSVHTSVLVFPN